MGNRSRKMESKKESRGNARDKKQCNRNEGGKQKHPTTRLIIFKLKKNILAIDK